MISMRAWISSVLSRRFGWPSRRTNADNRLSQIVEKREMAVSEVTSLLGDLIASVQRLAGLSQLAALAFGKTEPATAQEEAEKYLVGELVSLSSNLRAQVARLSKTLDRQDLAEGLRTQDGQVAEGLDSA
jgi:hypothetical protein